MARQAPAILWLAVLHDCLIYRLRDAAPEAIEHAWRRDGETHELPVRRRRVDQHPEAPGECTVSLSVPFAAFATAPVELVFRLDGAELHRRTLDPAAQRYTGNVDAVWGRDVVGWASALSGGALPPGRLLIDGRDAGDFRASLARPDLNEMSPRPATSGFRVPLPDWAVDGRTHEIEVRFDDIRIGRTSWAAPRPWWEEEEGPRQRPRPPTAPLPEATPHVLRALLGGATDVVLHLSHRLGGGTARYVADISAAFAARGCASLLGSGVFQGDAVRLALHAPDGAVWLAPDDLPAALRAAGATRIRALLHALAGVGGAVSAIGDLPYSVIVHDHQWFCPRADLVDITERYCGEPAARTCQTCVRITDTLDFLDEDARIQADLPAWLARNARLLAGAQTVVAPTQDAARRLRRHVTLPNLRVLPHPEPVTEGRITRGPDWDATTRIAVVGDISVAKGAGVLCDLAQLADRRAAPIRIRVIGTLRGSARLDVFRCLQTTGRYDPADLPRLLAEFNPHFVLFPAIWPETWCYTLSEVWALGYPAIAFPGGALAERIRLSGAGLLLVPPPDQPEMLLRAMPRARDATARLHGHRFPIAPAPYNPNLLFTPPEPAPARSFWKG
jgi:hypothetical protein